MFFWCDAGSLFHSLTCVTSFAVPWVCESGVIAGHGGTQRVQEEEPVGPPPTQCERFVHTVSTYQPPIKRPPPSSRESYCTGSKSSVVRAHPSQKFRSAFLHLWVRLCIQKRPFYSELRCLKTHDQFLCVKNGLEIFIAR